MIHWVNWVALAVILAMNALEVWLLSVGSNPILTMGCVVAVTLRAWFTGLSYGKLRHSEDDLRRERGR